MPKRAFQLRKAVNFFEDAVGPVKMPFLTVRMYAVSVRAGQVLQRIVSRKERKRHSVLLAAANGGRRGIAYTAMRKPVWIRSKQRSGLNGFFAFRRLERRMMNCRKRLRRRQEDKELDTGQMKKGSSK